MLMFDNFIVLIRILFIFVIILISYFLYRIGVNFDENKGEKIGLLVGGLYVIFFLYNDGVVVNVEIFFVFFVIVGFLLLF